VNRAARLAGAALCLVGCAGETAPELPSCARATELACVESTECTLDQVLTENGKSYQCRPDVNECQRGFAQKTGSPEACEAKPGCRFVPASCYCAPDVLCVCGGGPPSQCAKERE
jgi:hypothetical protein